MDYNSHDDLDKLRAKWQASIEEMRRYEEFYAGHDAQLASNVYYRTSKARAAACFMRINELAGFQEEMEVVPAYN
ncbi:MAG TPA: hypothetical protein VGK19_13695 [Capsulimonadaceae bacterium]|jgi:hypothetical protein